jgi:hypothetical protein
VFAHGAEATTASDAPARDDLVILASSLCKYRTLRVEGLLGKIVIDALNQWWEVDGIRGEFTDAEITTSMRERSSRMTRIARRSPSGATTKRTTW